MAIFHYSIKIISRGKGGRSAVAAAAYRAGEKIINERDGTIHDYTRKGGVVHTEIMLPSHAPSDFSDRSILWNAVERIEKAKNSQLAREIELSLPVELTKEQNINFALDYVNKIFVNEGMCADVCIHDKGDGNPHAHIMLTMRPINEDGTWGDKQKKVYAFDNNGNKIYDPKKRQYMCNTVKTTDWHEQTKAEEWRAAWSEAVNIALAQYGHDERVDHRSYERQGIDQLPTVHLGVAAHCMEQHGIATERGDKNRNIEVTNRELRQLRARINKVKNWLYNAPLTNTPTMVEMMQGVAGGHRLNTQWQKVTDLKVQAEILLFLGQYDIKSMGQLIDMVEWMHKRQYGVANRIKEIDRRLGTLAKHFENVDVSKRHRAVVEKYMGITDQKNQEAYAKKHADEMGQYKKATAYLMACLNGRTVVPEGKWRGEREELVKERYSLCEEYYKLKDSVKSIEILQRNAEYIMNENSQERASTKTINLSV
jgi:ATP-dependent exoDNAse (exonuclease V) alpha subunit